MCNIVFWKKVSTISFYSSAVLLIMDTFFFENVGFYSFLTVLEITSLITLIVSSLILFFLKRRNNETI